MLVRLYRAVFERTRPAPRKVRIAATLGITAGCFIARAAAAPLVPPGYPFLPSYLGLLLCASLFNATAGLLSLGISAVLAALFFPPAYSLRIESIHDVVALGLFVGVGLITTLILETLHRTMQELRQAERLSAAALREYRHRTRNDFARLAALLLLRARMTADPIGRDGLEEAANQARHVAMIQGHLSHAAYDLDGAATVDASALIHGICTSLAPPPIRTLATIAPISTERGMILGLLLVELVGAARRGGARDVRVMFTREGGFYHLRVSDDRDPAAPAGLDPLQRRLVEGLGRQLHGLIRSGRRQARQHLSEAQFPASSKP